MTLRAAHAALFGYTFPVTYEKALELLQVQAYIGQGYNRYSARLILAEMQRELGQNAVAQLIVQLNIHEIFGFNAGDLFKTP